MSDTKKETTNKKPQQRLLAAAVNSVKKTAPMAEKKKPTIAGVKSQGQPKKEDQEKANTSIVIYLNKAHVERFEANSVAAGYSAKDRAKWLKSVAIAEQSSNNEDTEQLKSEVAKLQATLEAKEEMIAMLEKLLTNK